MSRPESFIVAVEGGRVVDLAAVRPEDVALERLAGPLARINRFAGRTPQPWSVAAHSLVVASILQPLYSSGIACAGLFHDAHEALLGDVTTPTVEFAGAQSKPIGPNMLRSCLDIAKHRVDRAIEAAWGVEIVRNRATVAAADRAACDAEMVHFLGWQGPLQSDEELFDRAVEVLREDAHRLHAWEDARDLWSDAVLSMVARGVITPPAEAADAALTPQHEETGT